MKFSDIAKHRLLNQQLIQTNIKTADQMVSWFGAIQGQEYAQTKWSLGLRLPFLNDVGIEKDFTDGKILRTHLLRPTWHFVSAKDMRWLLKLTAPRVKAANAFMYRKLELESALFNRCNDIIIEALRGKKQLTRDALNNKFKENKIKADGHRLSYIMMQAELDGIICSGARQGSQFTYALLEDRVPKVKSKDPDEALAELTKRYFTSRAPATVKDFSTWSGLTLTDCRKGVDIVRSLFNKEMIEKQEYFFFSNNLQNKKKFEKFHMLPVYDEFIMGYKDRSAIMLSKNKSSSAFHYDNMILFEGQIVGTWKRKITAKSIHLDYIFFERPNKKQFSNFEKSITRFEKFNNLKVNY